MFMTFDAERLQLADKLVGKRVTPLWTLENMLKIYKEAFSELNV